MKHLRTSLLGVCLLAVPACGGQADEGGRDNGRVGTGDAEDAGAADDDAEGDEEGAADDDAAGDDSTNQADEDPAGAMPDDEATPESTTPVEDLVEVVDPDTGEVTFVDPATGNVVDPDTGVVIGPSDVIVSMPDDAPPMVGIDPVAPTAPNPGMPGIIQPVPVPGIPPGEPPPPAENCMPSFETSGPDYCELQLSCDNDNVYSYCYYDAAAGWYCNCSTNYTYGNYQLTGVDGATACGSVSDLCAQAVQPEFTEEPVCMPSYESLGPDYCERQVTCTQSADLGGGVTAISSQGQYAFCSNAGDGTLTCSCSTPTGGHNFSLAGSDLATSCSTVMEVCSTDVAVEFTEPEVCNTSYQYDETTYCERQRACTQSAAVSDGITAEQSTYDYTYCSIVADKASCNCSNETSSYRFDMGASGTTTCDSAMNVCASDAEIALTGSVSCAPASQNASGGYCQATLDCTQSADIGGSTVSMYGSIYASCQLTAGTTYSCTCSSGTASASVEVQGDTDWAACTSATTVCEGAVEVQIGSNNYYGGGVIGMPGRPVPLSTEAAVQ